MSIALVAAVPAQLTVSDGNTNAVFGALSATAQTPPSFALRGDALATNHAFEHGWYYRVAGDTRENSLRNIGTITEGVIASNDHADRDFTDVDSRGLLKASHDIDTYDAGPASGVVISRLTLMNRSNAAITVDVFSYADLDIAGTSGDDSVNAVSGTSSESHFVTDSSGVQIEVRGIGADTSAVAAYPTLRTLLSNTSLDNLTPAAATFTGDYTGAFQWTSRTLQPFEQLTFTVAFAIDTAAAALPQVNHYGAGNGSSFEIHTTTAPVQDNTTARLFKCQMKGALPNVEHRTILGLTPTTPFPFIPGLDLWVLPASIFAVFGGFTSATGEAQEQFIIPAAPYFAGISVYFQVFSVDAAAPNGYAYFSPGMRVLIGKI